MPVPLLFSEEALTLPVTAVHRPFGKAIAGLCLAAIAARVFLDGQFSPIEIAMIPGPWWTDLRKKTFEGMDSVTRWMVDGRNAQAMQRLETEYPDVLIPYTKGELMTMRDVLESIVASHMETREFFIDPMVQLMDRIFELRLHPENSPAFLNNSFMGFVKQWVEAHDGLIYLKGEKDPINPSDPRWKASEAERRSKIHELNKEFDGMSLDPEKWYPDILAAVHRHTIRHFNVNLSAKPGSPLLLAKSLKEAA